MQRAKKPRGDTLIPLAKLNEAEPVQRRRANPPADARLYPLNHVKHVAGRNPLMPGKVCDCYRID
jgi:hypothetical protein